MHSSFAFILPPFPFPSLPHLAATTLLSTSLLLTTPSTRTLSTTLPHPPPPPSIQQAQQQQTQIASIPLDPEHAFADQVWSLIDNYYLHHTPNSTSWPNQRLKLLSSRLPDRSATYSALRKSIRNLDDRYTRLLTPADMETLRRFDVSGVGLLLTSDTVGNLIVATTPAKGTSAATAGVARGDVLLAVDGVSVTGEPAFLVSQLMQGKEGSEMELEFRDRGIVRLERHFVEGKGELEGKLVDTDEGKMGYIRLGEFRASARGEVGDWVDRLVREGAEWIVLDLRGNGGGVFEGALEIAGLFEGADVPVVKVLARNTGAGDVLRGEEMFSSRVVKGEEAVGMGIDLAVIVDGRSASSSEVLAGGLRNACRAAVVGETTFGKGLIQGVFGLPDGGGVVITVAEYLMPEGEKIQGVGLKPDVERKAGGWTKIGRLVGIEKLDPSTVRVSRAEVKDVVNRCRVEKAQKTVADR